MTNKTYDSEATAVAHDFMLGAYEIGAIDKSTMRKFNRDCLTPLEPLSGDDIRQIREDTGFSQAAFAIFLNISKNHVSAWERGVKKPSGCALRLLTLVKKKGIKALI